MRKNKYGKIKRYLWVWNIDFLLQVCKTFLINNFGEAIFKTIRIYSIQLNLRWIPPDVFFLEFFLRFYPFFVSTISQSFSIWYLIISQKLYKTWYIIPFFYRRTDTAQKMKFSIKNLFSKCDRGRVAWWLATCARKPKVPGSSPAASYAQRWAARSNRPANV